MAVVRTDEDFGRIQLRVEPREDDSGGDRRRKAVVNAAGEEHSRHEDTEGDADRDENAPVTETVRAMGKERLRKTHRDGCRQLRTRAVVQSMKGNHDLWSELRTT